MRPVSFAEQSIVFGQGQPEYLPLPAHISDDGIVTTCWQLDPEELQRLVESNGKIWLRQLTCGQPLQPQMALAEKPEGLS